MEQPTASRGGTTGGSGRPRAAGTVLASGTRSTPSPGGATGSAFLPYVHAFRALAMTMIVAQHASWIFAWPAGSPIRPALSDLLDNSTVLFVFLSGFLFSHLADRRWYLGFVRRRLGTVVLPYLLVLLPAAVLAVLSPRVGGPFTDVADEPAALRFGWFLLHGATLVNVALWFVPMIALYYLASPVFDQFIRRPRLYWLLLALLPFSLLAHRPTIIPHVDTLALAAYYQSAYVFGMCVSQYRARLEPLLRRGWWALGLAYLVALAAEVVFDPHHGNYEGAHLFSEEHGVVDWIYAQKLLLCLALLAVALRFSHRLGRLRSLGFASFSVFLVHCYVVNAVKLALHGLHLDGGNLLSWAFTTAVALGVSLLIIVGVRRLLGTRAVYVIGSAAPARGH